MTGEKILRRKEEEKNNKNKTCWFAEKDHGLQHYSIINNNG